MPTFIDLSHTIEDGLITYRGLPAPVICDFWSREFSQAFYEEGTSFQIGKIEMVANTGTYLDTPFHRYEDGADLSEISLDQLALLPAILIHIPHRLTLRIDQTFFQNLDLAGKAVLVHTGWDEYWNTENYYQNHPFLTTDAAKFLVSQGVRLVGIDAHNIDDVSGKSRPVHSILLRNQILIVEHLCNLGRIPATPFSFTAVPPKIKGMGTFPVRAFAALSEV